MVEGAPVKMVDSILKYVQQRARSMTGDALERLIAAQCQACVLHLRSASMSYDDAHAILNLLGSDTCVFTHEQVAQVSAVVDQKLAHTAPLSGTSRTSTGAPDKRQQTHSHLVHYMTGMMWAVINSHVPMSSKLEQCAQYFVNVLLLRHPSEPTRRDMVAIIRAATNDTSPREEVHCHMSR